MEKEKIKKLFSDDGFINQLLSKETPEEVQLLLEEQDVFISIKEIIDFKEQIKHKLAQITEDNTEFELTEEEMEHIAGGVFPTMTIVPVMIAAMFSDAPVAIGEKVQNVRERW